MFFRFPPDARWNPDRNTVEFGIGLGEYEGVVCVSRRVFQILLLEALTPERCLEAYHLHRTRLEIMERKVRRKQLTEDGNVEITGRDLREREVQPHYARPIGYRRAGSWAPQNKPLAKPNTGFLSGSGSAFRPKDSATGSIRWTHGWTPIVGLMDGPWPHRAHEAWRNDALAICFADATLASAFVARWCAMQSVEIVDGVYQVWDG
jgi:hypothetical protein